MSVESVSSRCLALAADVEDVLLRFPGGEDAATLDRVASELARLGGAVRVELSRAQVNDLLALLDQEHEATRSGGSMLGASSVARVEAIAGVLVAARDRG